MTEGALALLAAELGNLDCGAARHPRHRRGSTAASRATASTAPRDDRYLAVGALEPKFWIALNQAHRPAAPNVAELRRPPEGQAKAQAPSSPRSSRPGPPPSGRAILAEHDCCVELVTELDELPDHPLHRAREVFFTIDGGPDVGPVRQVRTPLGTPKSPRPPPRQGEHTREVLAEYGFSDDEIDAVS